MWNEKLAARASAMRARFSRMAEVLRLKEERIRQGPISPKEYVERRITPDQRRKGMEKSREAAKAHGDAHRNSIIEIESGNMQAGKTFRDPSKRSNYPCCPRCSGSRPEGTIRAGLAHGIQRYRCLHCRSTFSGATVVVKLERQDYKMLCYHCGSIRTKRVGKGVSESRTGRMGVCLACKKKFVQGGLKDLQKYHLLLEKRIMDLNLPGDVEAEVLQIATMDVLTGKGYCWTVDLDAKEAWRNCRGEYGQRGSDHPQFREQMGQTKADRR